MLFQHDKCPEKISENDAPSTNPLMLPKKRQNFIIFQQFNPNLFSSSPQACDIGWQKRNIENLNFLPNDFLQCNISTIFEPFSLAADVNFFACVQPLKNFKHIIMITPSSLGLNSDNFSLFENLFGTSRSCDISRDAKIAKETSYMLPIGFQLKLR